MHRSKSFGGFGMFFASPEDVLSRQELASLVDPTKKEPTKITKQQIKKYGAKYKNFSSDKKGIQGPWYR